MPGPAGPPGPPGQSAEYSGGYLTSNLIDVGGTPGVAGPRGHPGPPGMVCII